MKKPNFLIVGSAKCGTTTLSRLLSKHPDCCMSHPKEVKFFNDDSNYAKGISWYEQSWKHYKGEDKIGEATPRYTRRDLWPDVAKRALDFNPDFKIIHIARNPYEKLVSFWRMSARGKNAKITPDINRFFKEDPRIPEIINSCRYEYQLEPYFSLFPKEAFHLMLLEDFKLSEENEVKKLLDFLELDLNTSLKTLLGVHANAAQNTNDFSVKTIFSDLFLTKPKTSKQYVERQDLNEENRKYFIDCIREDALIHLNRLGKPSDFWSL